MQYTHDTEGKKKLKTYPNYESFIEELDDGTKLLFKPASIAKWLWQNEKFKTDFETGILFYFNEKNWSANGEVYLQKIVSTILDKEDRESHFRNILHALKGLTYCNIEFSKKIACENGLLDVETSTISDFNAKEMPLHSIDVTFDPEAECPNWIEFIKQVVTEDDLATIQEWSGFLILPDYRFHKLLWVHGKGRNGKGVWQRTIEAILGIKNISGVGLEEFDGNHRFALKQLYGKLFNPCSEPPTNKILQTPLLKKATGQDTIEAEIKGKQNRLTFRNYSKITVLANKFPKVNDQTIAFKERRLFIKFPNEFVGSNQIQNVEDNWLKINDERSGILNWMLQGLKRLLEQGYFTESKTQQETEKEFLRASDSIGAFLAELCFFNRNMMSTRSDTFDAYKNYCDVLGLDGEGEQKFTARLKDTPKVSIGFVNKPRKERAWKGLGLNGIDDEGKIIQDNNNILDTHFPVVSVVKEEEKTSKTTTFTTPTTPLGVFTPSTIWSKSSSNKEGGVKGVVDVVGVVTSEEVKEKEKIDEINTRNCGMCGKFHLASCGYIGGNFEKVPAEKWAGNLTCFIPIQPEMPSFEDKEFE